MEMNILGGGKKRRLENWTRRHDGSKLKKSSVNKFDMGTKNFYCGVRFNNY